MQKAIIGLVLCMLFGTLSLTAQEEQTFRGTCVLAGAEYVLSNLVNKTTYKLDDQVKPRAFAGRNVVVLGTLNTNSGTIHVSDIKRALTPKVSVARSVYVDCDACPRAMAAAKRAALLELADWNRFRVLPDRRRADLIFLFSANPYLGDYLTRDGPDTRPVSVNVTFMNVIDPVTGETLWGECRRWGSWRVPEATRDLIADFRKQLNAEEGHIDLALFVNEDQNCTVPQYGGK